jgi:hypothetical protein
VLSKLLSIVRADIDWKYESVPARSRQLQPPRDIHCSVENRKCPSRGQYSRYLLNFQLLLATVQLPQRVPLRVVYHVDMARKPKSIERSLSL